ncbi:hypothetical protein C8R43DRAFT_1045493 [Mycena crocata]|nr:hypothetical protein C8R43DRAFT_1045493 [Mycena crocata]
MKVRMAPLAAFTVARHVTCEVVYIWPIVVFSHLLFGGPSTACILGPMFESKALTSGPVHPPVMSPSLRALVEIELASAFRPKCENWPLITRQTISCHLRFERLQSLGVSLA